MADKILILNVFNRNSSYFLELAIEKNQMFSISNFLFSYLSVNSKVVQSRKKSYKVTKSYKVVQSRTKSYKVVQSSAKSYKVVRISYKFYLHA